MLMTLVERVDALEKRIEEMEQPEQPADVGYIETYARSEGGAPVKRGPGRPRKDAA